jgi:hypothetical protein
MVLNQLFIRKEFVLKKRYFLENYLFSYKDCPSFDLDKLLEDVQNGLYPITAYHLLYPTQSSLIVPTRSTISDKGLTSSTSSLSSLASTATENDLTTPIQTITDSSIFLSNDINSSAIINNGVKSRTGTMSSVTHHEKSGSMINDGEHNRRDSITTSASNNNNHHHHHPTVMTLSNTDEKEKRRIIDIQCKIKTKDTGLCMVKNFFERISF